MTDVVVIAKEPVAGRVKTRLMPDFSAGEAAALARAALADTLDAVAATPARRRLLVLDGRAGAWVPDGFTVVPQCAGGLDARLAASFDACAGPALLIGMDTPQVTPALLRTGTDFGAYDAWFGPAADGGFWALGLAAPDPALLLGVPMSVAETGAVLSARLRAAGLRTGRLPVLRDVDTAADAASVARLCPGGRFAALHARLTAPGPARAGGAGDDGSDRARADVHGQRPLDGVPFRGGRGGPGVSGVGGAVVGARGRSAGAAWGEDAYARALRTGGGPLFLRRGDGWLLPLEVERWLADADGADESVLVRCRGAVLDVGCGPGRLVAALAARGHRALGVDVSPAAVHRTVLRGGAALCRSVFQPLPGEGRWDTALLLDGNIGIGGDPAALLARAAELLAPGGRLIAEAAPVEVDERCEVRLDSGRGTPGAPFPWARLGPTALRRTAEAAGWSMTRTWRTADRPFAELRSPRA